MKNYFYQSSKAGIINKGLLAGVLLGFLLVLLGWALAPNINLLSVFSACTILMIYFAAGWFGVSKIQPGIIANAGFFGLLSGTIFATEILLEYAVLPKDNTSWGIIEFSCVFTLYFLSSLAASYRLNSIKNGIRSSILSAMLSSIIWMIFVLVTFYIFKGTTRQELVFKAEGNYQDFSLSGMTDFNSFITEDFFGAVFFHLLLSPLIASILGTAGGWIGITLAKLRKISPSDT
ncbi:MAG: hypothetical protein WCP19_09685 [Chloroflexota bacterium]